MYPQVFECHADSVGSVVEGETDYCKEVNLYYRMADERSYPVIIEQILREYACRYQDSLNDYMGRKEECCYSTAKSEQRPPERFK